MSFSTILDSVAGEPLDLLRNPDAQTWMCWLKAETLLNAAVFNHNVGTGENRSIAITALADTSVNCSVSLLGTTLSQETASSATGVYSTGTWVHVAALALIVVEGVMLRAAVVPDSERAGLPT